MESVGTRIFLQRGLRRIIPTAESSTRDMCRKCVQELLTEQALFKASVGYDGSTRYSAGIC